jgi:hypothetical protein
MSTLVSDRRWFQQKVSAEYLAEYLAETEYSARVTETENEKCFQRNVSQKIIDKLSKKH